MIGPETFQTVVTGIGNLASIVSEIPDLRKSDKNYIEPKVQKLSEVTATILASSLKMMEHESGLREKARKFEEDLEKLKNWELEKERYELKKIEVDGVVYALKPSFAESEAEHNLCTTCFEGRKKRILQTRFLRGSAEWYCSDCGLTIARRGGLPKKNISMKAL